MAANDESTPSGFTAQVEGASLVDLIQMHCLNRSHAVFKVSTDLGVGYLYFDQGQVVHAEFNAEQGERALYEMFVLESGRFQPAQRAWPARPSIRASWESLVLRAAQQRDEAQSGVTPRPAAANPGNPAMSSPPKKPPVYISAVRVTKSGEVLSSRGDADGLIETAAFVFQLSQLVGQTLGLGTVLALEAEPEDEESVTLLYQDHEGHLVALQSSVEDARAVRKKAGLS
jgi:hypothetical protein